MTFMISAGSLMPISLMADAIAAVAVCRAELSCCSSFCNSGTRASFAPGSDDLMASCSSLSFSSIFFFNWRIIFTIGRNSCGISSSSSSTGTPMVAASSRPAWESRTC
ncbi:hypothetical protein QYO98_24795 [Pseudomonas aeruginosa]|nr:hypothetical protein [Pseudomonas aeruginosa]